MAKVQVVQGWLEGELLDLVTGDGQYHSFKGIPYAEPPVGKLRFKAPRPALPWEGIKKATAHGPMCAQQDIFTNELVPGSEDCLFLNVYTRNLNPKEPLPVMVFIHGGGYKSGSGDEQHYGPDFLVNNGVVLVTINYRLDALGFLCLDTEEVPGNAGLKDQVAALRWVKDNIRSFGGDPNNVTIFGESAGGASVVYHLLSPMSKGLFHRAISMSGVPLCDWSVSFRPRQKAFALGKQLGFETEDANELLNFLQSLPTEKLIDTKPIIMASEEVSNILKSYHFIPVTEKDFGCEHFLVETPMDILKKGKVNEADVLIGHTNGEVLVAIDILADNIIKDYNRYPELLVPRKISIQCPPDAILNAAEKIRRHFFGSKFINKDAIIEFVKYANESSFFYDIHRLARMYPKIGKSKLYFYVLSCLSERNFYGNHGAKYGLYGAAHLDDLLYLFDAKWLNMKIDKHSREYKLIQLVNRVFTNFAKYGTPTPDDTLDTIWPEYNGNSRKYVEIGEQLTVGTDYDTHIHEFWRGIYEDAGVEF